MKNLFIVCVLAALYSSTGSLFAEEHTNELSKGNLDRGIAIKSIEQTDIPDFIKDRFKNELAQMQKQGFVYAEDRDIEALGNAFAAVLDRKQPNLGNNRSVGLQNESLGKVSREKLIPRVIPIDEIIPKLTFEPSTLPTNFGITDHGVVPSGHSTEMGWTAISRFLTIKGLGKVIIDEKDFANSEGGMVLFKESINQDVNGHPANLTVKRSYDEKKAITQLM